MKKRRINHDHKGVPQLVAELSKSDGGGRPITVSFAYKVISGYAKSARVEALIEQAKGMLGIPPKRVRRKAA